MPNSITQIVQERREDFEKTKGFRQDVYSQNFKNAILSHQTQTIISVLEGVEKEYQEAIEQQGLVAASLHLKALFQQTIEELKQKI